jgi:hypothetical protein
MQKLDFNYEKGMDATRESIVLKLGPVQQVDLGSS